MAAGQGCQILICTIYQNGENYLHTPNDHTIHRPNGHYIYQLTTKYTYQNGENYLHTPNDHTIYQMGIIYPKIKHKLYRMAVKFTKIFHSKALLKILKLYFGMQINHLATLLLTSKSKLYLHGMYVPKYVWDSILESPNFGNGSEVHIYPVFLS
jgi:hypothetical protein